MNLLKMLRMLSLSPNHKRTAPLAALRRNDGTITGNIIEMDRILRENWRAIFCKHDDNNPVPKAESFFQKFNQFIDEYPIVIPKWS